MSLKSTRAYWNVTVGHNNRTGQYPRVYFLETAVVLNKTNIPPVVFGAIADGGA